MSEGRVKSGLQIRVGRCANCGTLHAHATTGCICYLCGERIVTVGAVLGDDVPLTPEPAPCSRALINELYARREGG